MNREALEVTARQVAAKHGLDPALVCALVEQESGWNPWAIRYEPAFYDRYVRAQNLPETEARARAFSWGLLQVMGQVAREHGFSHRFLSALCDPDIGLEVGCRVLKARLVACEGDVRRALLRWNGGGRKEYADEVLARVPKYRFAEPTA